MRTLPRPTTEPFTVIGSRKPPAALQAFLEVAPRVLQENFSPNCCLNGTRVLMDALAKFKLQVRPLSVSIHAYNQVWWKKLNEKGDFPGSAEESLAWQEAGGYSLGVVESTPGEGWNGHLVGLVQGWLVDVSVGQLSRPEHALGLPQCLAVEMPTGAFPVLAQLPNDAVVLYGPRPTNVYRQFPGFLRSNGNVEVARAVANAMQHRMTR